MSLRPTAVLHAGATSVMAYGYMSLKTLPIDAIISKQKGGHSQYLTIQALFIAWAAMLVSLFADLLPRSSILRTVKRTLMLIALPLAVTVSSIYWPLLLLASHLILQTDLRAAEPSSSDELPLVLRLPLSIDLALHAVPAIALLCDFYLFERRYDKNTARVGGATVASLYGIVYAWWVEHLAKSNETFPYPFLTINPFPVRIGIYVAASSFAFLAFLGLNTLHRRTPVYPAHSLMQRPMSPRRGDADMTGK